MADYAKLVAKAWSDPDFHRRLTSDPAKTLKEEGWDIHPSMNVQIKQDSSQHSLTIGLPKKPEGLSDEKLREAAGAACSSGAPCC